jgi:hypothetical protein
MKHYLEYAETGRVLMACTAPNEPPPSFGGTVIETEHPCDPARSVVADGAPVDLGPPPTAHHIIDYETCSWRLPDDMTALRIAQDGRWAAIRAERDRREAAGFPYLRKLIDSDSLSVQRITTATQSAQAAIAIGAEFSVDWTCADNSVLTLNAEQMLGMPVALADHANALHVTARVLRAEIEAAETPDEVEAITWDE